MFLYFVIARTSSCIMKTKITQSLATVVQQSVCIKESMKKAILSYTSQHLIFKGVSYSRLQIQRLCLHLEQN